MSFCPSSGTKASSLAVLALLLAACSSASPTPTAPAPTSTPLPAANATSTSVTPTATPSPTSPPTPTPSPTAVVSGPAVIIDGVVFQVEIARTSQEQSIGLSGRPSLAPQTGMLFPQPSDRIPSFWMLGMLIPLDFVWIGGDCTVKDLTLDVPPPEDPSQRTNLPIYSPSVLVRHVFEINAGEAQALGVAIGDPVRLVGTDIEGTACGS